MKLAPLVLLAALSPAFGQTVSTPAAIAGAALQQWQEPQVQTPVKNTCTPIIVQVAMPSYNYVEPESGYAPSWQSGSFDRAPPFSAPPSWQGSMPNASGQTSTMHTSAWTNADSATQMIASSATYSSASASSTVNSWTDESEKTTTESTAESTITVNGKTYRSYKHELKRATLPALQTRALSYCR
ncbi:hypothetical protein [Paraburkholderia oxyphila]|uniref:hypothetical protein n=1 Tax=Paraburkholderia oxyphila TaxID=614212 RepID=UPI0012ED8BFC|nr:hypothetical protein [Paraburkholderia oxyphila]